MQGVVACFLIILFSCYLIYDIQRVIGCTSNTYEIDEYIIAAMDIYIDIVVIF